MDAAYYCLQKRAEAMSQSNTLLVRVLFLHEGDSYVAQCLEYDIAAQGKTLPEVKLAFERTLVGQMMLDMKQGRKPLEGIGEAPRVYFEKFERAVKIEDEETFRLPQNVPPAFVINGIRKELRVI
jgi:hypothetical protein